MDGQKGWVRSGSTEQRIIKIIIECGALGAVILQEPQAFVQILKTDNKINVDYSTAENSGLSKHLTMCLTCCIHITFYLKGRVMRKSYRSILGFIPVSESSSSPASSLTIKKK